MTTIACLWVKGHVPFTSEYVVRLHSMVKRWMDRPYRFVCLTDNPAKIQRLGIETIPVTKYPNIYAWWTKLRLFDNQLDLQGRVLYLDLDTLVVGPLASILEYPAPFALIPHSGKFDGIPPRQVVKRFNSSVMVWDAGTQDHLFWNWKPIVAERLFGDQDWIGVQSPGAAMMPLEWFPRISAIRNGQIPAEAKVVLVKKPKNAEAARIYPWVREAWC